MWYEESVFYQINLFGFCQVPERNDGVLAHRIQKVTDWIPHMSRLGINAVYFCPFFESDAHGYDTRDYLKLDCRLGDNEDLGQMCEAFHKAGIRIVFDGVFNHVGRGFWAFEDVLKKREQSAYKDWFHINFGGNNGYDDGLWYEGWEGHYELVKLNLQNPQVKDYLFSCVDQWMDTYKIDGLRLDVAYMVDKQFLRELRSHCLGRNPEFFLLGEMIHGDYNQLVSDEFLHSATNYECYKGLYSSFNSMNLFEIGHSLQRQFGSEPWCLYRGKHLLSFADNHDVTRVASILNEPKHIPLLYALLLAMPGIPCIYYGSEWGAKGEKSQRDSALRPAFDEPQWNELTDLICKCVEIHKKSPALCYGEFRIAMMTNRQLIIERSYESQRILVAINADGEDYMAHFDAQAGRAKDLITGRDHDFGGGSLMPGYSAAYWEVY